MADSNIQLNPGAGGDKLDSEQLVVGAETVKRERDQIAGKLDVEIAEVKNAAPGSSLYGLVVRNIPSGTQAISQAAGTAVNSSVADSATVVTLLAANAARKGMVIANAVSLSPLYVKFGSGASSSDFNYVVQAGQTYEMPPSYYAGIVTGIWLAAGSGAAKIVEIS